MSTSYLYLAINNELKTAIMIICFQISSYLARYKGKSDWPYDKATACQERSIQCFWLFTARCTISAIIIMSHKKAVQYVIKSFVLSD